MPLRVSFHTLGCKLNQLETEAIADAFARAGALVLPALPEGLSSADLVVVNTCTVTGKAERSARRILRLALAADPGLVVLATGCYAQVDAAALAAMDERIIALPGEDKAVLLALPARLAASGRLDAMAGGGAERSAALLALLRGALASETDPSQGLDARFSYSPEAFAFHSRPALKIQDGCDNDCAYCRVRIARGKAASLPAGEALARARALEEAGRAEIVLTGVNLSQYRDGGMDFSGLLAFLLEGTNTIAFRISSYEPDRIDSAFLESFAHPRVRPHVHLAVQSGADSLLSAMGRRYRGADVLAAVQALLRSREDPFIAADFIAGFPGETEAEAEASLELARQCGFAWIHAFRFSPRPGTRAASLPDPVPPRIAAERAQALLELGREAKSSYLGRWMGRETRAVLERDFYATTENYLKLKPLGLPAGARPGQELFCRISGRPEEGSAGFDAFALYIERNSP